MIPQASCPRCCNSERPSHISGAALTVPSCKKRPSTPHTEEQRKGDKNETEAWNEKQRASLVGGLFLYKREEEGDSPLSVLYK